MKGHMEKAQLPHWPSIDGACFSKEASFSWFADKSMLSCLSGVSLLSS